MSNTNRQIEGAWGLYPWFEEHGAQLIHSEDLDEFRKLSPYGKVFLCIGEEEDGFIQLAYGKRTFRVRPELFHRVPPVSFPIGTHVIIRSKNVEAIVDAIQWHQCDAKPIYYLRRDGNVDSRRYSADDLSAATSAP